MTPRTLGRRLAVSALAATTAVAGLATLAPSASAAAANSVSISAAQTVAAGTCAVYTLQAFDAALVPATDAASFTVQIAENPNSATQDVDFCVTSTTTPLVGGTARYNNGLPVMGAQTYGPGSSVTPNTARPDGSGNPDVAASQPSVTATNNNSTGVDTASFNYTNGVARFGVAGLVPGTATITAFIDKNNDGDLDAGEPTTTGGVTFREGGQPGTDAVANAARTVDAEPETGSGQQGNEQRFTATVTNSSGDTLFGVTPRIVVTSGVNAATADQVRALCGETDNSGVATCVFQGAKIGTDNLRVFVQQTAGGTAGPDATEPSDDIVRTTTIPSVSREQARFVDLSPSTTTTTAGTTKEFTVLVTAATGAPVRDVSLVLTEDGPGRFTNGQSSVSVVTNTNGVATATVTTVAAETPGNQIVTAAIFDQGTTQCTQAAGAGTGATTTTPAGNCSDSSVNTVVAPASPSPSASASASPSASATPMPTATASPTASASPSQAAVRRPTITVNPSTIIAVEQKSIVSGTAQPGSRIEIHAYSRPNTTYRLVRSATVGANGQYSFEVGPSGNTRLFARTITPMGQADSGSIVLTVRVSINLKIARLGGKTLRFTGSTLPKRPGQLVTVFYQRAGSNRVIASRARVTEQGTYNVTREFTGTGTFDFFTGTGTDITNAENNSARVRLTLR